VISKVDQTNNHDDKQEDVGYKRGDIGHFGGLDIERRALVSDNIPCFADLLKI
jgi:hypothetical protein